jgi:hypothetical protein
MIKYAHRQKLTVPNSLALAAAAVLVWSANGSSTELNEVDTTCYANASVVATQQSAAALPSMRATPEQCGTITALQPGDAVVNSVRDAGFRLLYLPAKVLLHN